MTTEIVLLYLWTRLDMLTSTVIVVAFGFLFMALFTFISAAISKDTWGIESQQWKKAELQQAWARKVGAIGAVIWCIACLIPSKHDAAIILAGTGIAEVAKTDTAQRLASKSVQVIEKALDGYLNGEKK